MDKYNLVIGDVNSPENIYIKSTWCMMAFIYLMDNHQKQLFANYCNDYNLHELNDSKFCQVFNYVMRHMEE